jgi:hypothetical protein
MSWCGAHFEIFDQVILKSLAQREPIGFPVVRGRSSNTMTAKRPRAGQ